MTSKSKIAKSKRNNQKKNKLIKQGIIKKTKKKQIRKEAPKPTKPVENAPPPEESEESDHGEDILKMVEEDDISFLKEAIANRTYNFFNKVRYTGPSSKKMKLNKDNEDLEENYEKQEEESDNVRNLLPIKTKSGIVTRTAPMEEELETEQLQEENDEEVDNDSEAASEDYIFMEQDTLDVSKPITTAHLMASRVEALEAKKLQIGNLSSAVLENPEEKINNLSQLLKMIDNTRDAYLSVKKLVIMSVLEIFKDILPLYHIKHQENSDKKLKKDTLKLQKYEVILLQYYKSYLIKLEKIVKVLINNNNELTKKSEEKMRLSQLAVHAMCELLVTHPYFNYSENICRSVIPFLNHKHKPIREEVTKTCQAIFKDDKKGELTLKILRIINHYLKSHLNNVNAEMLQVLLYLNIKDINLDLEKEREIKQKKLESHKQRVLQLSKKEKKRKKRLNELEKELMETKAEENKQIKQKNLTEIMKITFGIYFRILKSCSNTRVLTVCLEGLSKYAHCINLEFYVDLVNVLDNLLKADWLGYREQLYCIKTVFTILGGQGELLNLDPSRFYTNLYKDLLTVNAMKYHQYFATALETLNEAIIKRRKKNTNKRTIGFVKRISTLSLQMMQNGSLGCLAIIRISLHLNRTVDKLLDLDISSGDGQYNAELEDPEYCNAESTAMYELLLLNKHFHPTVSKYARHIMGGVPTSGPGSLPPELGKCEPQQLFEDFDMSTMAFNPPVAAAGKGGQKTKAHAFSFKNDDLKDYCYDVIKSNSRSLLL